MKKANREVVALIEENGDHVINYNYDGKGNNFTIMDFVKKHANAEYENPDSTFKYFKQHIKNMRFIREAGIKGIGWKEVWEHFNETN